MEQEKKGIKITVDAWINEDPAKESFRRAVYCFSRFTLIIMLMTLILITFSFLAIFYPILSTVLVVMGLVPIAIFIFSFTSFEIKEIKEIKKETIIKP
mgnify:FL=1